MDSLEVKEKSIKEFKDFFETLAKEFIDSIRTRHFPDEAIEWVTKNIYHNVPGGKMNRGLSVIDTLEILKDGNVTTEELFKARVLGWCIEWLQAFFLVADDIMDASITRRGNPCWYKMKGIGTIAVNDSFILESAVFFFLKKYFRQDPYYIDLVDLFHEIILETELGQMLDLITAPLGEIDLNRFSMEKYKVIVVYKTAFYSFYLPVALAMHMAGIKDPVAFQKAKDILLPLGEYFQIQDDYLDCYGLPEVIGKIGTDIEDNKCSWCVNIAISSATPEQRKILDENYGKKEKNNVEAVKEIFRQLDVEGKYKEYEEESFKRINGLISQLDESILKREIFISFMNKIYKRTK